jgi:2-oxoglutarate ferredoxin oxidoreductase subunit alpha
MRTLDLDALDFGGVEISRGELLSTAELDALDEPYLRYKITPSGVSPRALPGHPNAVWVSSSNEHDERGAISEDMAMRVAQVDKRARKHAGMASEMPPPTSYGPASAKTTYVCWGSTHGPLREAVNRMNAARPGSANMVHLSGLWPFPTAQLEVALGQAQRVVTVEVNSTGQLARLMRTETGRVPDAQILRYDGRPFTPEYIIARATG